MKVCNRHSWVYDDEKGETCAECDNHPPTFLETLREANEVRCLEWMKCSLVESDLAFHGLELGGEAGELQNVLKKLVRWYNQNAGGVSHVDSIPKIEEECADVIICVDMIAGMFHIDLKAAVIKKFNSTSEKNSLETYIPYSDE